MTGPYKNTNFANAFRVAKNSNKKDSSQLVDYEPYLPSYNSPASFIASPIYDGDKKIAVLIFQMPIDKVNQIVNDRTGLGETGETFIVGKDRLLRSDTYNDKDNRNIISAFKYPEKTKIKSFDIEKAVSGTPGNSVTTNYFGKEVLASYSPMNILGNEWAIISSIYTSEAFHAKETLAFWVTLVGICALVLTTFFAFFAGNSIAKPILKIAGELQGNAKHVSSASEGLAKSSGNLSSLAAHQASSIEETAASIEEISAMVKNNVDQAEKSSELSSQVKTVADKGNHSMNSLIESMKEIIESNQKIQDLVKVIGEIGEKTSVIDEIVFQTKLLSFNASVEAERAGEHGRGFAVVAQEVGNLAQMSGKAASEIANMVKDSIRNAEKITSENKVKVEQGNNIVLETAKHLKEIAEDAEHLLAQAKQIVSASKEQSEGIIQVNEAMNQLDHATQQNASTAENTAIASESLASQADRLKFNVGGLVGLVNGSSDGRLESQADRESNPEHSEAKIIPMPSQEATIGNDHTFQPLKRVSGDTVEYNDSGNDGWEKL